jgi:adenosine deaminase
MHPSELKRFITQLPKAELHCHLEGSIQPARLLRLAERNGIALPFDSEEGARAFYQFDNLNQFLRIFGLACSTLRTARDFEDITVDLGADAARQGIWRREVFFTFAFHERRGIRWEETVTGIASGRRIVAQRFGVDMAFILDIDRTIPPEDGLRHVELAHADRERLPIIGVGLDAQEQGYPASRHEPAFARAAELGLHRVAHAGEDVGPESVREALDRLRVERIDHGVRAIEDRALVAHLAETRTPLTVCPASNIALKVYRDIAAHPVKQLIDAGVVVTLNSDDPPMFDTDTVNEYAQVAEHFSLGHDELIALARASLEASFAEPIEKATLLQRFDEVAAEL